jgi:hypothetical protein
MGSPVPISVVRELAKRFDYDQVVVYAKTAGGEEHMTLYGRSKSSTSAVMKLGRFLKYTIASWTKSEEAKNVQIDKDIRA